MKNFSILCILLMFVSINGISQSKVDLIEKFIKGGLYDQVSMMMIDAEKKSYPNITESTWEDIIGTTNEIVDSLRPFVIEVYAQYLDLEDIENINAFNESKTGKKLMMLRDSIITSYDQRLNNWAEETLKDYLTNVENQKDKIKASGNCSEIISGEYYYIDPYTQDTVVVNRTKNKQVEKLKEGEATYHITWSDDCSYVLECINYINEDYNYMIGLKTEIQILEILPEKIKFVAYNEEADYINVSHLFRK